MHCLRRWLPMLVMALAMLAQGAVEGAERAARRAQVPPGGGRNSQINREAATAGGAPQPGAAGQPAASGGGGIVEANRNYAVEIAIVVIFMGGALWAVCKSARRV